MRSLTAFYKGGLMKKNIRKMRLLTTFYILLFCIPCISAEETSITGHSINAMDKRITDWIGTPPEKENTYIYSNGEYIWKDAKGDDTGAGGYTPPLNEAPQNATDLLEFRVTYDNENVYFLITCSTPGEWWAPYRVIGIDKDGSSGSLHGSSVLAQGNPFEVNSYSGTYAELKVAPQLACEYVVVISSTYKGRIWNDQGKLIAKRDAESSDTKGFHISDPMWTMVEVAVPISIIGDPAGQTWRFIVGIGTQDNDYAREVYKERNEWHGGGGEGKSGESGPDPDIYDLAGAPQKTQEEELSKYNPRGEPGDTTAYATIYKSYLTVKFAAR